MTKAKIKTIIAATAWLGATALSLPAGATDDIDTCRKWGGDESQSLRCFDCVRRVWTGYEWKLVNTCAPRYVNDFGWGGFRY